MRGLPRRPLRVLQCGFPKSGNYGVYRLLRSLLAQNEGFRSFKRASGLAALTRALAPETQLFPEMGEVDSFRLRPEALELELPFAKPRWVAVDAWLFVTSSSLLWTHDPPSLASDPRLAPVTHRVYVLRDVRDVVTSLAHHVVRDEVRRQNPQYRYRRPEDVLADLDLFERYVRRWKEHVGQFLRRPDAFLCVRLEDLIEKPLETAARVAAFLGVEWDPARTREVLEFQRLARHAPGHMRSGRIGNWRLHLGPAQLRVVERTAGSVLEAAGYPRAGR